MSPSNFSPGATAFQYKQPIGSAAAGGSGLGSAWQGQGFVTQNLQTQDSTTDAESPKQSEKRSIPPAFTPRSEAGLVATATSNANANVTSTFSTEHLSAPAFVPRSSQASTPIYEKSQFHDGQTEVLDGSPVQGPSVPRSIAPMSRGLSHATSLNSAHPDLEGSFNEEGDQNGMHLAPGISNADLFSPPETSKLDHHLYSSPLPHTANLPASHLPLHNFFLPNDLLSFIHKRAEAKLEVSAADANLPAELHVYHSLHTLYAESTPQERSPRVFGFVSDCYRAKCRLDGRLYCLRRIEGFKLVKEAAFSVLDKWRRIRHPNIVSVREAFTTRLFGDACELAVDSSFFSNIPSLTTSFYLPLAVVFAYDFHPESKTLYESHLSPTLLPPGQANALPSSLAVPERLFWSYVTQIANGLKAIHTAGLACRTLEPTKVLLTGRNR